MLKKVTFGIAIGALTALVGCSVETHATDAVEPETDGLEPAQIISSWNGDGEWTAEAHRPSGAQGNIRASATFTGPGGSVRKMGLCLLVQWIGSTCNSPADCTAGDYCTAPNGVGTKRCHRRYGSQTEACAGTPALGGIPIAPGTYETPATTAYGTLIPYACFEGCAVTDPSTSSSALYAITFP